MFDESIEKVSASHNMMISSQWQTDLCCCKWVHKNGRGYRRRDGQTEG